MQLYSINVEFLRGITYHEYEAFVAAFGSPFEIRDASRAQGVSFGIVFRIQKAEAKSSGERPDLRVTWLMAHGSAGIIFFASLFEF